MTDERMESYEAWQRSVKNFSWLSDAVSGAMDVDLLIERKGHFLVFEAKPWHSKGGIAIPYGQHRALFQLSKQPNTTVFLLGETKSDTLYIAGYHDSPAPDYWVASRQAFWRPEVFRQVTKAQVREMAQVWWHQVEGVSG